MKNFRYFRILIQQYFWQSFDEPLSDVAHVIHLLQVISASGILIPVKFRLSRRN